MQKLLLLLMVGTMLGTAGMPARAETGDAQAAFEKLSSLAGTWNGKPEGTGDEAEAEAEATASVVHEIKMSAAGTVVMETMNPGTEHEMINMYHVDGEDLLLTHYCAGGNQPEMRLNRETSTAGKLVFDFAGGTNLDPAVDQHIHAAVIEVVDSNHVESVWKAHAGGEEVGTMTFHLVREE